MGRWVSPSPPSPGTSLNLVYKFFFKGPTHLQDERHMHRMDDKCTGRTTYVQDTDDIRAGRTTYVQDGRHVYRTDDNNNDDGDGRTRRPTTDHGDDDGRTTVDVVWGAKGSVMFLTPALHFAIKAWSKRSALIRLERLEGFQLNCRKYSISKNEKTDLRTNIYKSLWTHV